MTDLKKVWTRPELINLNQSVVMGGALAQTGVEGVKFLNGVKCGITGTIFATMMSQAPVFADICGPGTCYKNSQIFIGASSDTDFNTNTSIGICS